MASTVAVAVAEGVSGGNRRTSFQEEQHDGSTIATYGSLLALFLGDTIRLLIVSFLIAVGCFVIYFGMVFALPAPSSLSWCKKQCKSTLDYSGSMPWQTYCGIACSFGHFLFMVLFMHGTSHLAFLFMYQKMFPAHFERRRRRLLALTLLMTLLSDFLFAAQILLIGIGFFPGPIVYLIFVCLTFRDGLSSHKDKGLSRSYLAISTHLVPAGGVITGLNIMFPMVMQSMDLNTQSVLIGYVYPAWFFFLSVVTESCIVKLQVATAGKARGSAVSPTAKKRSLVASLGDWQRASKVTSPPPAALPGEQKEEKRASISQQIRARFYLRAPTTEVSVDGGARGAQAETDDDVARVGGAEKVEAMHVDSTLFMMYCMLCAVQLAVSISVTEANNVRLITTSTVTSCCGFIATVVWKRGNLRSIGRKARREQQQQSDDGQGEDPAPSRNKRELLQVVEASVTELRTAVVKAFEALVQRRRSTATSPANDEEGEGGGGTKALIGKTSIAAGSTPATEDTTAVVASAGASLPSTLSSAASSCPPSQSGEPPTGAPAPARLVGTHASTSKGGVGEERAAAEGQRGGGSGQEAVSLRTSLLKAEALSRVVLWQRMALNMVIANISCVSMLSVVILAKNFAFSRMLTKQECSYLAAPTAAIPGSPSSSTNADEASTMQWWEHLHAREEYGLYVLIVVGVMWVFIGILELLGLRFLRIWQKERRRLLYYATILQIFYYPYLCLALFFALLLGKPSC